MDAQEGRIQIPVGAHGQVDFVASRIEGLVLDGEVRFDVKGLGQQRVKDPEKGLG